MTTRYSSQLSQPGIADASARRNEQRGVLIAGVPYPLSPIPSPFPFLPIPYPSQRPLRRLTRDSFFFLIFSLLKLTVKLLEMHVRMHARMHISAPVCKLMSERFLIGITMKIRSEKLTFMNSRKEPTRIVSVG